MIYIVSPGGTREKGGMGRVVDNIASDLRKNCPEVAFTVVDTYGPGRFLRMPGYFILSFLRLFAAFAGGRATLVHVHMAEYGSVLRKGLLICLARAFGVPVVLHLHGGRFPEQYTSAGPTTRRLMRAVVGMAAEVVVLGEYWRHFMTEHFPGTPRVTVLHNAVPGPETVPVRPADAPPHILFLGRLIPLKGIDVLLDALASPACRDRTWVATIAGDGSIDTYRQQVETLGLAGRVRFTGWLDQAGCRRLLGEVDIMVQPSWFEGLPMAVLEGMAYGLSIVATPVGAVPDAIADGDTGLLVPPGDSAALAAALVRLMDDAGLRRRLGGGARERFEQQFSMPVYRERLLEIYRRNALSWTIGTTTSVHVQGQRQ
jgi:glycosyltransferase involved in cell wall biosynthesis